jgi:hypothetical protein
MYRNIVKTIYDKLTANIILNGEKLSHSPKIRHETSVPTTPLLFNIVVKFLAREIWQEEEIKGIQIGKETVKTSFFADDKILYLEDPKTSAQKLLDNINSYSKVAGYKINLQKSLAFLYTKTQQTEKGYRETIPFTIVSQKINYVGVHLTKDVNDLKKAYYKFLKKENEEDYR